MFLQHLSLVNFKNYASAELSFCANVNCFTGHNGEGKTNLLDAVHYLSFCKSFFNPVDSQNIMHEAPFFVLQGTYDIDGTEEEIYCGLKRNQKKQFKRNKKEYTRLADHIGLLPLVMISPADSELITGGSEDRRKFIDSVIAQFDKAYLDELIIYNKVLSQRNALLKSFSESRTFDKSSIEIWDIQLIDHARNIHLKRSQFIEKFIPIFQEHYDLITNSKEKVSLSYNSHLNNADFSEVLTKALKRDMIMQYTTVGIHKDDLEFNIDEHAIKKFGSQGQQKSYLIALKLAQFSFIKKVKKVTPILLLDDIYDKLDELRVKQLMDMVTSPAFGQIFITDTQPDRLESLFKDKKEQYKIFSVNNGTVHEKK